MTLCAEGVLLSVALTTNGKEPAAVGVPVIAPVVVLSVSPVGKAPVLIDHVYGPVPL